MRRLALGFILLGALIPAVSLALGLGEIEVDSALNQPLRARIQLLGTHPAEIDSITARLASEDVFRRVGLDRPFYLNDLRFEPAVEAGRPVILITTEQGVREPFLNFLVEVSWPNGRLTREYTILLDPPLYMAEESPAAVQPPAVEEPVPTPAPESPAAMPEPRPAAAAQAAPPEPAPAPAAPEAAAMVPVPAPAEYAMQAQPPAPGAAPEAGGARPDTIEVVRGDTLWEIASAQRPQGVSVNQMMMALLRANPQAFIDNNINNLKRGYVLRMPSREEIDALSREEATLAVREQNALWREYRRQFAGQAVPQQVVAEAPKAPESEAVPTEGDDLTTAPAGGSVELLGTAAGALDSSGAAVEGAEGAEDELAMLKQALEARRQESLDLRARVEELQQLIEDKNRLLELKDQQLAELQARLGEPPAASGPDQLPPATEPAPEVGPVAEPEAAAGTEAGAEPAPEPVAPAQAPEAVEPPAAEPEAPAAAAAPAEPEAVEEPRLTPPEQAAAAPSFVDDLLGNPQMLMVVGFGGLLVLALVWLLVRRLAKRSKATPEGDLGQPLAVAGAAAAATAATAVAGGNEKAQAASAPAEAEDESPAAAPEPDLEAVGGGEEIDSDDTTAEADVYLAYGLHQQAEDLLKGALADHPDKDVYRLKLLETYYATKDKAAFDAVARELHERLGGQGGVLWDRAVAMGKELSPDNPLFSGADAGGLSVADFAPRKPEGTDIDLDFEAQESAPPADLDIGLDQGQAAEAAPADEVLDLDLDLEDTQIFQAEEAGGSEPDLNQETPGVTPASPVDETAEIDLDLGAFDADDEKTAVLPEPEETQEAVDISFDLDEGDLALDTEPLGGGEAGLEASPVDETAEIDLGDLGDLSSAFGDNEPTDLNEQLSSEDLGMVDDEGAVISEGDEVGTKLDLAKAYIDMGDAEGARSTLEEVIAEGNEAQRREAQELMQQIA